MQIRGHKEEMEKEMIPVNLIDEWIFPLDNHPQETLERESLAGLYRRIGELEEEVDRLRRVLHAERQDRSVNPTRPLYRWGNPV